MTQQEILDLLKKEKKWLSSKQIAKKLGITSIHRSLNILNRTNEILKKQVKTNSYYEFQWKIK